jgi:hypothetical protein
MPLTCLRPYQKKKKVVYFDLLPMWNIKKWDGNVYAPTDCLKKALKPARRRIWLAG